MNCAECHLPIIPGQQLPVVLEWGKKDREQPEHLGRQIAKAVHMACDLKMRGKPDRPIAKLAGTEPIVKAPAVREPSERQQKSEAMGHKFIYKISKSNPRKEGTWGWKSFELVKDGMTVDEYLKAGGRKNDLAWDVDHKFAELLDERKANGVAERDQSNETKAAPVKKGNSAPSVGSKPVVKATPTPRLASKQQNKNASNKGSKASKKTGKKR